jgi:hypothetical protein
MVSGWIRWSVALVLVLTALGATSMASAGSPVAHAAGRCSVGSGRGYGYSYLTYLWVSRTSCSNGSYVAKHHGKVRGWRCSKKILDRSSVQYDAKVSCSSGRRQVRWIFTQNT